MDDSFSPDRNPERDVLRRRVRAQLADEPLRSRLASLRADSAAEPDARPLYRELGRLGLLAVDWPLEHGGGGRDLLDASIVVEELVRAGVPDTLHVNTIQIVGLFLLMVGTPEQKAAHLPDLAAGRRFASVLYTEPLAGSDLASLSTTAVREGDGWRLSGVKTYSLKSDVTDLGLCAARTGPPGSRYDGISLFLLDLHAAGVHRRVIPSIANEQFHRVELDGVRVDAGDLLGAEGNGWALLSQALAVERTGLDYSLKAETWLNAAVAVLAAEQEPHPAVLEELGRHGARVATGRLMAWQVLAGLATGRMHESTAAASKLYSSEQAQQIASWAATRLAPAGDAEPGGPAAVLDAAYREAPGLTISAGTSEMMLNIVANLALDDAPGSPAVGDITADPVRHSLQAAVRRRLDAAAAGPPAVDRLRSGGPENRDELAWSALRALGAPALDAPVAAGGLELGLTASSAVSEELGRAALAGRYLAVALAIDVVSADGQGAGALMDGLIAGDRPVVLAGFGRPAPTVRAEAAAPGELRLSGTVDLDLDLDPDPDPDPDRARLVLLPVALPAERVGLALLDRSAFVVRSGPPVIAVLAGSRCADGDVRQRGEQPSGCPGAVEGRARVRQAAYLLGLAEGALEVGATHAAGRRQFDRPLRDFQSMAFRLAAAHVEIEGLRLAVGHAAGLADAGRSFGIEATEVLALAAETAATTARMVMQVCGARGMTGESHACRYYLQSRREAVRLGRPGDLWREAGRLRLGSAVGRSQQPGLVSQ